MREYTFERISGDKKIRLHMTQEKKGKADYE